MGGRRPGDLKKRLDDLGSRETQFAAATGMDSGEARDALLAEADIAVRRVGRRVTRGFVNGVRAGVPDDTEELLHQVGLGQIEPGRTYEEIDKSYAGCGEAALTGAGVADSVDEAELATDWASMIPEQYRSQDVI